VQYSKDIEMTELQDVEVNDDSDLRETPDSGVSRGERGYINALEAKCSPSFTTP
jgi:hypothetical protein